MSGYNRNVLVCGEGCIILIIQMVGVQRINMNPSGLPDTEYTAIVLDGRLRVGEDLDKEHVAGTVLHVRRGSESLGTGQHDLSWIIGIVKTINSSLPICLLVRGSCDNSFPLVKSLMIL